jgi:diadenosine tetraphosphate (Ap4A) HIT family hydrolase
MDKDWILWQDKRFVVATPKNPHIVPDEGCHIKVYPKKKIDKSWDNPKLAGETFELASRVSKIIVQEKIADWINIQNNGNWGLLPGRKLNFHIHVYGRKKKGKTWGKPVKLPELPETFKNAPLSKREREILKIKFNELLK